MAQVAKQGNDVLSSLAFVHEKLQPRIRSSRSRTSARSWTSRCRTAGRPSASASAQRRVERHDRQAHRPRHLRRGRQRRLDPGPRQHHDHQGSRRLPQGQAAGRPGSHGLHRARLHAARQVLPRRRSGAAGAQPRPLRPAGRPRLVRRLRRRPRRSGGRRRAGRLPRQQRQPDPVRHGEPAGRQRQGAADQADPEAGARRRLPVHRRLPGRRHVCATPAASTCCRPPSPAPSPPRATSSATAAASPRSGSSPSSARA